MNGYDFLKSGLFRTLLFNAGNDASFALKRTFYAMFIKDQYQKFGRRTSHFSILVFNDYSKIFRHDEKLQNLSDIIIKIPYRSSVHYYVMLM